MPFFALKFKSLHLPSCFRTGKMGLPKRLFDDLPTDVICSICNEVFLDPKVLQCQHMFCSACLQRRKSNTKSDTCATCHTPFHYPSCHQPDEEFKLKLLNLNVVCNYKCGMKIILGNLPEHLKEECPSAPVICPNQVKGCKKKVKRCDISKHVEECDYRTVICEACGHSTVFQELFTHQSRKRCLERKLKQQVIRELRQAHKEVMDHRSDVLKDHIRREIQQSKMEVGHAKYLQERKNKLHQLLLSQSNVDAINNVINNASPEDSFFLTELEELRNKDKPSVLTPSQSRSTLVSAVQCDRCYKPYTPSKNHHSACRWHQGVSTRILISCLSYDFIQTYFMVRRDIFIFKKNG